MKGYDLYYSIQSYPFWIVKFILMIRFSIVYNSIDDISEINS